jgi:hypothetical protein
MQCSLFLSRPNLIFLEIDAFVYHPYGTTKPNEQVVKGPAGVKAPNRQRPDFSVSQPA